MAPEFERELEALEKDVKLVAQYFYSYQTIHFLAAQDERLLRAMKYNALYWNTSLAALQEATFSALGRVFDKNDGSHSVFSVLECALKNKDLFTLEALRARKMCNLHNAAEWIDGFMANAVEPQQADWRRLEGHVNKWFAIFKGKYRPLRHKVYAHADRVSKDELDAMFVATNYRELEKMVAFLVSYHHALWDLYHNGSRPVLTRLRYSVVQMLKHPGTVKSWRTVGEITAIETREVLERLTKRDRRPLSTARIDQARTK